jgi:hypothetical protein
MVKGPCAKARGVFTCYTYEAVILLPGYTISSLHCTHHLTLKQSLFAHLKLHHTYVEAVLHNGPSRGLQEYKVLPGAYYY